MLYSSEVQQPQRPTPTCGIGLRPQRDLYDPGRPIPLELRIRRLVVHQLYAADQERSCRQAIAVRRLSRLGPSTGQRAVGRSVGELRSTAGNHGAPSPIAPASTQPSSGPVAIRLFA